MLLCVKLANTLASFSKNLTSQNAIIKKFAPFATSWLKNTNTNMMIGRVRIYNPTSLQENASIVGIKNIRRCKVRKEQTSL